MWQDFRDFVEDILPILGLIVFIIVIVGGIIWLRTEATNHGNVKCTAQYGKDWKYTLRSATDCINTNTGEGKFLKD